MFARYAIFYTPPSGPLAQFGASWLGWDSATGREVPHPTLGTLDVAAITATPRKYGLHGTLKAPFRATLETTVATLRASLDAFAAENAPVTLPALALSHNRRFTALRPTTGDEGLKALAARIVRQFDPHRAPLTPEDIARRRLAPLTPRQDAQMLQWGYPYIFEDFHFHMTLSGTLPPDEGDALVTALRPVLMPLVPEPCRIDALTLMGEDEKGRFHQIHRAALTARP